MNASLKQRAVRSFGGAVAIVAALSGADSLHAQFTGFTNRGLVAVGRLTGDSFDALGPTNDSLGGIFSGLAFDPASWARSGDASSGFTYRGTFYCVPDRGYGAGPLGGTLDYRLRVHTLRVAVSPYYGSAATNQTQISLTNTFTRLFTCGISCFILRMILIPREVWIRMRHTS